MLLIVSKVITLVMVSLTHSLTVGCEISLLLSLHVLVDAQVLVRKKIIIILMAAVNCCCCCFSERVPALSTIYPSVNIKFKSIISTFLLFLFIY